MKSKKRKKIVAVIFSIISIFSLSFYFMPKNYLFVIVKGGSMEPTLKNNQIVIATTDTSKLFLGDIVVIEKNNETMVKRITAVQGAKYAENTSDEHSFSRIPEWINMNVHIAQGVKLQFKKIPANYFFVEGDNPNKSLDSKNFGLIRRNEIIAKCLYN